MPLPSFFCLEEKIVRTLFSDLVKKSDNTIRPNAFKSYPKDKDEVSVTRFSYTNIIFCKELKNFITKAGYCGFARLYAKDIILCDSILDYSPTNENFFHSDIKIGFEIKEGMTLHPYYSEKITKLSEKAKFFKDNCPDDIIWCGEEI